MASILVAMASNLRAVASNLLAMASNKRRAEPSLQWIVLDANARLSTSSTTSFQPLQMGGDATRKAKSQCRSELKEARIARGKGPEVDQKLRGWPGNKTFCTTKRQVKLDKSFPPRQSRVDPVSVLVRHGPSNSHPSGDFFSQDSVSLLWVRGKP